jgi:tetratricopeptide (TPR) repeat protein
VRGGLLPNIRLPGLAVLPLLLTSVSALGHANSGQFHREMGASEVSGSVSGAHGDPLPAARVQLQSVDGGFARTAYSDSSGHFSFGNVREGSYVVAIKASGYQTGTWSVQVGYTSLFGLSFSLIPKASGSTPGDTSPKGSNTVSVHQLLIPRKARKEFRKGVESASHGQIDEAILHWKKSIKIYPQYADSYMQLSRVYANRGDFAGATAAAKRAVALDGNSADAYTYLGYAYLKGQDFPNAQKAFQHAVRLSNSDWFSQFWLGQLLLRQKDAQGAFPYLRRASQLNPGMPEVYVLLYNDLLMLGRRKDALAELDDFLKRFPKDPLAAKVRATRKDLEKAVAAAGAN